MAYRPIDINDFERRLNLALRKGIEKGYGDAFSLVVSAVEDLTQGLKHAHDRIEELERQAEQRAG